MPTGCVFRSLSTRWLWLLGLLASLVRISGALTNLTFQNTDPALHYFPSLCDGGALEDNIPPDCNGTWTIMNLPGSSNGSVSSTIGASPQFGNLAPQVFFSFRAQAVYVKSSNNASALANMTISEMPSGKVTTRVFEPTADFFFFTGLDESQIQTLSVTFIPMQSPSRLDVDFIKISVSNPSATASILPTESFPTPTPTMSSATASSPSPTTPPAAALSTSSKTPKGTIIAVSVFGGLAVLAIASALIFLWRRRTRRAQEEKMFEETGKAQAATQVFSLTPEIAQSATYGAPGTFGSRMIAPVASRSSPFLPPISTTPQSLSFNRDMYSGSVGEG